MISSSQQEPSKDADGLLVKRTQAGDRQAYDLLVIKHQNRVMGLIHKIVNDPNDVPDIAQEAFVKAYRALDNFRGESAFYTWLYRIVINCAKNHMVKKGKQVSVELPAIDDEQETWHESFVQSGTPEQLVASERLQSKIFATIDSLPDDLQQAIRLREFDGHSYEEIAHIVGCPIGTVRSRIHRAREMIDTAIRPYLLRSGD